MPLVRIGKRRLAWEESEPAEIARIEFRDRDGNLDLRPSVYEVDAVDAGVPHRGQIVRVHDEHAVSVISPPRGGDDLIVDRAFEVEEDGETLFSFANERHRELRFPDEPALIAFVGVLMGSRSERRVQLGRDELFAYIAARLDVRDAEWERALVAGQAPHAASWNAELRKWRARTGGDVPTRVPK